MNTIHFSPSEFNSKLNNLISNGYEEYYACVEDGVTHVILTNTRPQSEYNGSVVDIWDNGRIEYSGQFKGPVAQPVI